MAARRIQEQHGTATNAINCDLAHRLPHIALCEMDIVNAGGFLETNVFDIGDLYRSYRSLGVIHEHSLDIHVMPFITLSGNHTIADGDRLVMTEFNLTIFICLFSGTLVEDTSIFTFADTIYQTMCTQYHSVATANIQDEVEYTVKSKLGR